MRVILICLLALTTTAWAYAPGSLRVDTLELKGGHLRLRVAEQRPTSGPIVADLLYLHGLGDRLDNHGPLFDAWNRAGIRVLTFDLPSHGENEGLKNVIDLYSIGDLARLALEVEGKLRESQSRPLLLAGWSTGGLIVTRLLQKAPRGALERPVAGAILFAPAVSVPLLIGDHGMITTATLTSNPMPPHRGPIKPKSPLFHPVFAPRLLAASAFAMKDPLPTQLPILLLVGGDDEDLYVKSRELVRWGVEQRTRHGAWVLGTQCKGAFHELDNEPAPIGAQVRELAAAFGFWAATRGGKAPAFMRGPCSAF